MNHGTILIICGINDVVLVRNGWPWGLRWAGLPHRIEAFVWQQGLWAVFCFADLWRTSHHRRSAERLAARIRQLRQDEPDAALHVLAHSAGTAIAAYALEQLDPAAGETVTSAVFVASGLSPSYDLSRAIRACDRGLFALGSRLDLLTLGLGTTLLGTVDRCHRPAAGCVGFRPPSDPVAASRFTQRFWRPRDIWQGWLGEHLSGASPGLARRTLAGWIRQVEAEPGSTIIAGDSDNGLRAKIQSSIG